MLAAVALIAASCDDGAGPGDTGGRAFSPSTGEATLELSGGLDAELSLTLTTGEVGSETLLEYRGEDGRSLAIGGDLAPGRNPSDQVAVAFTIEGTTFVNELDGTCIVDVREANDDRMAGEFGCPQMTDGQIRVSATGTFTAAA